MNVEIGADIACPFCYIGKAQFDAALRHFVHAPAVQVRYRSFQLDPRAPLDDPQSTEAMLMQKTGATRADVQAMIARTAATAAQHGLTYDAQRTILTNTFDAHRLLHHAAAHEQHGVMLERLFRAYFGEGRHIGQHEVLGDLAAEVGLDRDEALRVLAEGAHAEAVREDQALARQFGIQGVPCFVFERKYAVSGAQGEAAFTDVLQRVWNEQHSPAANA